MQVILTQDLPTLGGAGDVVTVKSGYGANYLIPQGLAVLATTRNQRQMAHEKRRIEALVARQRAAAQDLASRLDGMSITLTRLVGDGDKIFGSVTTKDIADALHDEGIKLDRRQIDLSNPLKSLGVYEVPVRLHRDVSTNVKVWVVAD